MTNKEIHKKGCSFIPNFLDKETTATLSRYMQNKAKRNVFVAEGLDTVNSEYFWYADCRFDNRHELGLSRRTACL
jgi:hypothetical protein